MHGLIPARNFPKSPARRLGLLVASACKPSPKPLSRPHSPAPSPQNRTEHHHCVAAAYDRLCNIRGPGVCHIPRQSSALTHTNRLIEVKKAESLARIVSHGGLTRISHMPTPPTCRIVWADQPSQPTSLQFSWWYPSLHREGQWETWLGWQPSNSPAYAWNTPSGTEGWFWFLLVATRWALGVGGDGTATGRKDLGFFPCRSAAWTLGSMMPPRLPDWPTTPVAHHDPCHRPRFLISGLLL